MSIGKLRKNKHATTTAIGSIKPVDGLDRRHTDEALRLARPAELPSRMRTAAPRTPRSLDHVAGAVKMMIGCARTAGMGSIQAVSEAVSRVVRRTKHSKLPMKDAVPVAIEAAADSAERLTIDPREAAAAAGHAASQAVRRSDEEARPAVEGKIFEAIRDVPEVSGAPGHDAG